LAVALAMLAGCYSSQAVDVGAAVADWRASQASAPAPRAHDRSTWTADELVARALEANPDLLAWGARAEASAAAVDAAGEFADLEVRLTEGKLDQLEKGNPTFEIALRGRPPRPGTVDSQVDSARLRAEEVAAQRDAARRRLRSRVRRLHAEVTLASGELKVAQTEETLRARRRDLEQNRMEQQAASQLDVALAELDRAEVADEAAVLALRRDRALAELRGLLDLPAPAALEVVGPPGGVEPDAEPVTAEARDRWVAEAHATRAELRETGAALARSRADAYRARARRWPWLGYVQLSYEANDKSGPLTWGFALALDVPLFAWTGAEVDAQDAATRRRRVEHRANITRIAREVEASLDRVARARERLDAVRGVLLPAAAEAGRLAEQAEATQALDALRAVRLQVSRLRARRRHLDALRGWVLARVSLDAAVGR